MVSVASMIWPRLCFNYSFFVLTVCVHPKHSATSRGHSWITLSPSYFMLYLLGPLKCCFSKVFHLAIRGWFHKRFTSSFYKRRSQKRKKTLMTCLSFALLGSLHIKAAHKHAGEIEPEINFIKNIWAAF